MNPNQYLLVTNTALWDFNKGCVAMLADGWQLYGNPVMARDAEGNMEYGQAFVRVKEVVK